MKKYLFFFLIILSYTSSGYAEKPKADISFLCFDLKYNKQDGIKICEMQQGITSGYYSFYEDKKFISPIGEIFCQFIEPYAEEFWVVKDEILKHFDTALKKRFKEESHWHRNKNDHSLLNNKQLINKQWKTPNDPYSIEDYYGLVIKGHTNEFSHDEFRQKYPGILLLNDAFSPHHRGKDCDDKYKASLLFQGDDRLEKLKPQWQQYTKVYSKDLVEKILNEFSSEMLVIKPRSGSDGNGVLIIFRDDLDKTLKYILKKSRKLSANRDPSYSYWFEDEYREFIVEEYIPSDPISIPHLDKNGHYDGTMRVAICLTYDNHEIGFHFLEGFWKLPTLPIEAAGTLNDKHKSNYRRPYLKEIDSETQREVERVLGEAMPILYEKLVAH